MPYASKMALTLAYQNVIQSTPGSAIQSGDAHLKISCWNLQGLKDWKLDDEDFLTHMKSNDITFLIDTCVSHDFRSDFCQNKESMTKLEVSTKKDERDLVFNW